MRFRFGGLKVKLKSTSSKTKSRGIKPNAPITELISAKNGSVAAMTVATMA